jgi:hypothetical protein
VDARTRGRRWRAQRVADLRADDKERRTSDEAFGDGGGDCPDKEPQPGDSKEEAEHADHQRQGGGQLDVGGGEGLGEAVQRAENQDGHDADRAGEQQAIAAEGDRQGGSDAAGVEAVGWRDAGHSCLGHRLWQHGQREVGTGGSVAGEAERRESAWEVRVPPHSADPFEAPCRRPSASGAARRKERACCVGSAYVPGDVEVRGSAAEQVVLSFSDNMPTELFASERRFWGVHSKSKLPGGELGVKREHYQIISATMAATSGNGAAGYRIPSRANDRTALEMEPWVLEIRLALISVRQR